MKSTCDGSRIGSDDRRFMYFDSVDGLRSIFK